MGWVGLGWVELGWIGLSWVGLGWKAGVLRRDSVSPPQRRFLQCKSRGGCWIVELSLRRPKSPSITRVLRLCEGPVKDAQGRLRGL